MNCANCNTPLRVIHIEGWCPDCVGKLIGREEAARAQGWQGAFAAWGMYEDGKTGLGQTVPLVDALENAFKAGWAARGLPDPSRHGMRFAGQDKGGVAFSDSDPSTLPARDFSGIRAAINDAVERNPVGDIEGKGIVDVPPPGCEKEYRLLTPVHPERVAGWFLELHHYWFDGSFGPNAFYGMRELAATYLNQWVKTGMLPPAKTQLEIQVEGKFDEWLRSSWKIEETNLQP